jgi:hypothetical protein
MYVYTFSDIFGDSGFGTLNAVPSTGDSFLVTSGTLDITSSGDSNAAVGLYQLIPEGPGITFIQAYPGEDDIVDDLIYPNNDAVNVGGNCTGSTGGYLDECGLLFGPTGGPGSGTETLINLFGGNGSNSNDQFSVSNGSKFVINETSGVTFTLTPVPEPWEPVLLATVALLALGLRKRLPQ